MMGIIANLRGRIRRGNGKNGLEASRHRRPRR